MTEEDLPSDHFIQKRFQEWFKNPVPAEVDHTIRHLNSADLPFPVVAQHSHYRTRGSHVGARRKLIQLLTFGLQGAISLGVGVGFIILVIHAGHFGWNKYWPSPIAVIAFVMAIGFWGGLLVGSMYKLGEKYSYKD
jgi:hypothetical protein